MRSIVINTCYGGFDLSAEAIKMVAKRKGWVIEILNDGCFVLKEGNWEWFSPRHLDRDDPDLIAVVRELGRKADGEGSELKIVEIPEDVQWEIEDYDGREWVSERHRRWS